MAARSQIKRTTTQDALQSIDEVATAMAELGSIERLASNIKNRTEEGIAVLQEEAAKEIASLSEKRQALIDGIYSFAKSNREKLTEGGRLKTVKLPTGSFSWRFTPPQVALSVRGEELIKELKRRRLVRFIRTKEEVDKSAMLDDPKAALRVPGVEITQREEFVIKPSDLDVRVVKEITSEE